MSQPGATDRSITVGRDADNCVITSGDGNTVIVYQTVAAVATPLAGCKNPYVGLLAFTEADADRFFGREKLVADLWERFRDLIAAPKGTRLLAILGPSGSGKSSLARAGLVPELARRPVTPRQQRVATMTPGVHPLQALALLLAKVATNDLVVATTKQAELLARLQAAEGQPPNGLRQIAGSLCADGAILVLLIDQFEEIYSLCQDEAERKTFLDNLLDAASDPAGCLSIILTMRSDFLGATQANGGLNQVIAGQSVIVPAMSAEELRLAIAQPAIRAGHPIDEDTIQRLMAESVGRDGALPLLQFVLVRIWEGMVDGVTAAKTVADLGGVGGALGAEAERIYDRLDEGDRIIAQRAFLAMVQFNENERPTRHRARLSQLVRDDDGPDQAQALARIHGVVDAFAQWDTRLVTMAAAPDGDQTIEVSHEAIFEHWDRLRKWLADGMDDIRLHLRVTEAATEWNQQGRPDGSLWRPPDLDLLRALAEKPTASLSTIEKTFFQASDQALKIEIAARHRRELWVRIAAGFFLALFLGAAGLGYWALTQRQAARTESQKAQEQRSFAFAGVAWQAIKDGDAGRGLLFALEGVPPGSMDKPGFESASAAVRAALANLSEVRRFPGQFNAEFGAGGRRLVTSGAVGSTVRIWDMDHGEQVAFIPGQPGGTDYSLSPDGNRLATSDTKSVHVWDTLTGAQLALVTGRDASSMSFSPDGHRIAITWVDQPAGIWNADTGGALRLLQAGVNTLQFLPDGDLLSWPDQGPVQVSEAATGKIRRSFGNEDNQLAGVAKSGSILATLSQPGDFIFWSVADGKPLMKTDTDSYLEPVFSPDGTVLAMRGSGTDAVHLLAHVAANQGGNGPNSYFADIVSVRDGTKINSYAFSPDGHWLVTGSMKGLALWDVKKAIAQYPNGASEPFPVRTFGHGGDANQVSVSTDGRFILSIEEDGAHLWCMTPGVVGRRPIPQAGNCPPASFTWPSFPAVQLKPRPDNKSIRLPGASSDVEVVALAHHGDELISPDEDTNTARIWHTKTGIQGPILQLPKVREIGSMQAAYSPDDRLILTITRGVACIWDARTGQLLLQLPEDVDEADWSPDGKNLLVATEKTRELIGVDFRFGEALREQACQYLPRSFTQDERQTYQLTQAMPCVAHPASRGH